jgi:hypothetical protein
MPFFNRGLDTLHVDRVSYADVPAMPDSADLPPVVLEDERTPLVDRDPNTWAHPTDYYCPDAEPFCWIGEIE